MKNPVMTASGTFGYGAEYSEFVDLNALGAIVVKGISLNPRAGNPPPRIVETPCGMLNSIGLQNVGVEAFLKDKLPFLRRYDTPVVVNVLGDSIEDYEELCGRLDGKVEAVELNVSCPNVKKGGISFATDPEPLRELVSRAREKVKNSLLIVKLSPVSEDIGFIASLCEAQGADALSLINTIPGMAIDIESRKPLLANVIGGLSGPAIKPIGVRMVWQVYQAVKIPIIGMGGIMSAQDAIEYMLAGAKAVAVGTANFVNPSATVDIINGIKDYMKRHSVFDINELTGGIIWQKKDPS